MKNKNSLSLNQVGLGDTCYIERVDGINKNFIKRMYDLGFVENSKITPLYKSAFGNTIAYLVKGSVIALREIDTNNITVCIRR